LIQRPVDLEDPGEESKNGDQATADSIRPQQLDNNNRYFVLGLDRVIASWEISKGWQVNVGSGFASARTNLAAIPDQGVFAFVEMVMQSGIPQKLQISKISSRGALTVLFRDAHTILSKLEDRVDLSIQQKDVFLRHLRQVFMSSVLDGADAVVAYLTSPAP
jgi:hypothetical protein